VKRVLLIYPRQKDVYMSTDTPYPFPNLGLTLLASFFPPQYKVRIVNEFLDEIDFVEEVDLVGITALTVQAKRAYEIADRFRERGVPVILGGVHATFMPDEAQKHADAVVVGEAELIMAQLIADWEKGALKPLYRAEKLHDLHDLPEPRRDLLGKGYSPIFKVIETTRGCPNRCEFCAVPVIAGRKYRIRPLADIDRELQSMVQKKGEYIFIVDDNAMAQRSHATGLFELLKRYGVRWWGFATIDVAKDAELLQLARESGCISLFVGFESLTKKNLEGPKKRFKGIQDLREFIRRIHDHGLGIQGSFIFGRIHPSEQDRTADIFCTHSFSRDPSVASP
jgi:radical SAM superfamily enzyme YgiQ (UPF0313 family)